MTTGYEFPPYKERISQILERFDGQLMDTYKGKDVLPLRDMKGGSIAWSLKNLYSAPKLEKIVFGVQSYRDKLRTYTTIIWPDDRHALPIFSSFWAESPKSSYFLVDYYPTIELICDEAYREHYYEPLEDLYDEGIELFPTKCKRDPDWFRALSSICSITAEFGPSTKTTQAQILHLTEGYLNNYIDLWEKDEARDPSFMTRLNARKEAVRQNLREKDPGGLMMEKAVGKELSDLTLDALF